MLVPYPEIKINQSPQLQVSDLHSLSVKESGSPAGYPVLVLHDGPGSGSEAYHRRLFDAERYRVIQYDQRGCGLSLPFAELKQNTPEDAVSDAGAVLEHLDISKAVLVGFGWGARIAVEYARKFPDKVTAAVLCGYGFGSKASVDWLFGGGARHLFPDQWQSLTEELQCSGSETVLPTIAERMADPNEFIQIQTAKAWASWLAKINSFHVHSSLVDRLTHPHNALTLAKLGAGVFQSLVNHDDDSAIHGLADSDVKGFIVHGRYDAVCPLAHGFELHQSWPRSELLIVRDAGHSVHDPAMTDVMLRVIGKIADSLDGVDKLNG